MTMPWIDGEWLDRKMEIEEAQDRAWRKAHPILARIRNWLYRIGWLHQ